MGPRDQLPRSEVLFSGCHDGARAGRRIIADAFRKLTLDTFNMSLGTGLNKLAGKAFRIAHLGDTNELTVLGALTGVEMALEVAGVPHKKGGVQAAMDYIADCAKPAAHARAALRVA